MSSGDVLGIGLGRVTLAVCLPLMVILLVPAGLTWVGFSAILGAIEGLAGAPVPISTSTVPVSVGQLADGRVQTSTASPTSAPDTVGQTLASARHGLIAGWADRDPVNQYARSSYRSNAIWLTWRGADCSAAALDWLLGAYGQPLASLDDAIALVGPGTVFRLASGYSMLAERRWRAHLPHVD